MARAAGTEREHTTTRAVADRRRRRTSGAPIESGVTEPRPSKNSPRRSAPRDADAAATIARRQTAARILARHEIDPSEFLGRVCRCGRPWPCDLVRYARLVAGNEATTTVRPVPVARSNARQLECLAASLCEATDAVAARALGMSRVEFAEQLSTLYRRLGVVGRSGSDRKLAAARAIGWLVVPPRAQS
jgi:hypothetical protein